MKRLFAGALSLLLTLRLFGCGGAAQNAKDILSVIRTGDFTAGPAPAEGCGISFSGR